MKSLKDFSRIYLLNIKILNKKIKNKKKIFYVKKKKKTKREKGKI